jgi:type I restriction enzyme S subunit
LASIKQYFPKSKDEQKLIGNFFENIDNLISEHHQKHAKLKSLNQAVLDKMFPKQGQVIPEIRFKGFEGDWVEYEVGEIFTVTRGNVLATSKISKSKNDVMQYPVYSSQTANNGLLGYYDEYLFENAITWTTDGANAGTVNYRKEKFYSTNVNGVLLSDEGFANKMVAEAINKLTSKYVLRVGNPKLMNNVMSQIKIILPSSIEEQSLISKKLILIEDVLFQHKHQIIKLNNIKKAFLAKMFI